MPTCVIDIQFIQSTGCVNKTVVMCSGSAVTWSDAVGRYGVQCQHAGVDSQRVGAASGGDGETTTTTTTQEQVLDGLSLIHISEPTRPY